VVSWRAPSAHPARGDQRLMTLAIGWIVIPTTVILIWSAVLNPIYTPRYLCFTAPEAALVLGVCIGALAVAPWMAAAILSVFTLAAGPYFSLLTPGRCSRNGSAYRQRAH